MSDARGSRGGVFEWISVLAVIALGLGAGALLTEGAVLVPYWRSLPATDFLAWFRENEPRLFAFFGPLEIAGVVLALLATGTSAIQGRRSTRLLAASALLSVTVLATYPLYFQEVNASFVSGMIPLDGVAEQLARWSAWHWARVAIGVAAFAAATLAIAVSDS